MRSFETSPFFEQEKRPDAEGAEAIDFRRLKEMESAEAQIQEKTLLEKFVGKAREMAGVFMLVTLAACSKEKSPESIPAVETPPTPAATTVHGENVEEINAANITDASKWSANIINSMKADRSRVKTAEDADMFLKLHVGEFLFETYAPKVLKAALKNKRAEEIKDFMDYTTDDYRLTLKNARALRSTADELMTGFGLAEKYKEARDELDELIRTLEWNTSYAGEKAREATVGRLKRLSKKD